MGIDIGFQNNARYWKLVHKKVTKRWYQRYLNGLTVMFFLPWFFLAWYFKCPELTQPLSHDSSKNQTAYQKDIVEQNLAQVFMWTGIHCFISSVNWFRPCKTKYVTDVSGTDKIFGSQDIVMGRFLWRTEQDLGILVGWWEKKMLFFWPKAPDHLQARCVLGSSGLKSVYIKLRHRWNL